ncbi:MAG TPA: dienelactone hydrolase family protein, partial [Gaiellaceae bacterium]|nr:dienelactone hydrolase family protein [Gaiellaceae bacterium]
DRGVEKRVGTVEVHDVSFASQGRRVAGYLVERRGASGLPGVVIVHGSSGDRSELLAKAVLLAARGAVALTITEPSTAHPPPTPTSDTELLAETREVTVEDVVAVRRAADVLQTLPAVDPGRIGYLGWSSGAKTGAFVAASDSRFKALALLSAGADPVSAFVAQAPAGLRAKVRTVLGSVDPLRYIALARPATILLEDGTRDSVVPHAALENFAHASPARTTVRWYPTDHALSAAAYTAAFDWLLAKLG